MSPHPSVERMRLWVAPSQDSHVDCCEPEKVSDVSAAFPQRHQAVRRARHFLTVLPCCSSHALLPTAHLATSQFSTWRTAQHARQAITFTRRTLPSSSFACSTLTKWRSTAVVPRSPSKLTANLNISVLRPASPPYPWRPSSTTSSSSLECALFGFRLNFSRN